MVFQWRSVCQFVASTLQEYPVVVVFVFTQLRSGDMLRQWLWSRKGSHGQRRKFITAERRGAKDSRRVAVGTLWSLQTWLAGKSLIDVYPFYHWNNKPPFSWGISQPCLLLPEGSNGFNLACFPCSDRMRCKLLLSRWTSSEKCMTTVEPCPSARIFRFIWGFHKWVIPNSWMVYKGKSK